MKLVIDFYNKLMYQEIIKKYFPEVKWYRDNVHTQKIQYAIECFSNGVLTYRKLINQLSKHTSDTKENIHSIVSKYVADWEGYTYKPKS